jgi:hypothetical protein
MGGRRQGTLAVSWRVRFAASIGVGAPVVFCCLVIARPRQFVIESGPTTAPHLLDPLSAREPTRATLTADDIRAPAAVTMRQAHQPAKKPSARAPAGQNKKTVQSVLAFLGKKPGVVSSVSQKARADGRLQMAMSTGHLNAAQRAVVTSIMDGENVFLTGVSPKYSHRQTVARSHHAQIVLVALKTSSPYQNCAVLARF